MSGEPTSPARLAPSTSTSGSSARSWATTGRRSRPFSASATGWSRPAGRDQPVADAANGLDRRPVVAQLLAELPDVDVDGASLAGEVGSPDILQEAVPSQDHPGIAGKRDEQVEL